MNWQIFVNQEFVGNIGWTLIHSTWQILLVALLLFCLLRIVQNASANLRYLFCVSALFLAIALPVTIFISFSANSNFNSKTTLAEFDASAINQPNKQFVEKTEILNDKNKSGKITVISENNSQRTFENFQTQATKLFTNFLPVFVWLWLFGVLLFAFRFCGGIWQTHKFKRHENSQVSNDWQKKFDDLCDRIGICQTVEFLQSEIVKTPMVIGWFKPFVIVPSSILLGLNPRELETIIAHELIHIRRYDYLVNILQSFIEIVLFFHPLTWWISAQVRREREMACDDEVLKIFESEPLLYANALANLEDSRAQTNNLTPSNILAANGGNLMLRIQRIIKNAQTKHSKGAIWASGLAFLLTLAISIGLFSISWNGGFKNDGEVTTKIDAKRVAIAVYAASQYLVIEDIADADETMSLLTNNLKRHKIPVVGYINNSGNVKVENMKARNETIVSLWRDAAFEIGANFIKFPKSYNAKPEDYRSLYQNKPFIPIADSPLRKKMNEKMENLRKKYGDITNLSAEDKEKLAKDREEFKQEFTDEDNAKLQQEMAESRKLSEVGERQWLKENNLKAVTFTINSVDWMYSNIYDSARNSNDKKLMKYVQDQYMDYLSKIFDYYEEASQQKFNRKIPQTFGLEPSRLVADSIDRILEMFQKRGYDVISMDEALKDEAFQLSINNFGGRSSFFGSGSFFKQGKSIEKPKPNEDIMTAWYEKDSKN